LILSWCLSLNAEQVLFSPSRAPSQDTKSPSVSPSEAVVTGAGMPVGGIAGLVLGLLVLLCTCFVVLYLVFCRRVGKAYHQDSLNDCKIPEVLIQGTNNEDAVVIDLPLRKTNNEDAVVIELPLQKTSNENDAVSIELPLQQTSDEPAVKFEPSDVLFPPVLERIEISLEPTENKLLESSDKATGAENPQEVTTPPPETSPQASSNHLFDTVVQQGDQANDG
jgi:hypothetical protein